MTIRTKRKYTRNPTRKQHKAAENVIVRLSLTCSRVAAKAMIPCEKIAVAALLLDLHAGKPVSHYDWYRSTGAQCLMSIKHASTGFTADYKQELYSAADRLTCGRFSAMFQDSK